jgi:phage terminase small subunit
MAKKQSTRNRSVDPEGLSERVQALWTEITETWDMERHHLVLLEEALRALDRITEARTEIKKHGIVVKTKSGYSRANPALQVERDAGNRFLATWKAIGFDMEPPKEVGRPPG